MSMLYSGEISLKEFIINNRDYFEQQLLSRAINVKDKIHEIQQIGNINLLTNAHQLALFIVEESEEELIAFAKQEGIVWAKYSLTLAFKLEWVQAIRRVLWNFIREFHTRSTHQNSVEDFFALEKKINELLDQFLTSFFINYSKYKDELLESQKALVEDLSVPIIPINSEVSILPLIGQIDEQRASVIGEKVIKEIGESRIHTLIIDLSGVANVNPEVMEQIIRTLNGISLMGSKPVITGLRSELVKSMVCSGINFDTHTKPKGTLQIALKDYI